MGWIDAARWIEQAEERANQDRLARVPVPHACPTCGVEHVGMQAWCKRCAQDRNDRRARRERRVG